MKREDKNKRKQKLCNITHSLIHFVPRVDKYSAGSEEKMANHLNPNFTLLVWKISLVSSGDLHRFFNFHLLSIDQSIHWGEVGKREQSEKQRWPCKKYLLKDRLLVPYHYCFGQKSLTQDHMSCHEKKMNSIPPGLVHIHNIKHY